MASIYYFRQPYSYERINERVTFHLPGQEQIFTCCCCLGSEKLLFPIYWSSMEYDGYSSTLPLAVTYRCKIRKDMQLDSDYIFY